MYFLVKQNKTVEVSREEEKPPLPPTPPFRVERTVEGSKLEPARPPPYVPEWIVNISLLNRFTNNIDQYLKEIVNIQICYSSSFLNAYQFKAKHLAVAFNTDTATDRNHRHFFFWNYEHYFRLFNQFKEINLKSQNQHRVRCLWPCPAIAIAMEVIHACFLCLYTNT